MLNVFAARSTVLLSNLSLVSFNVSLAPVAGVPSGAITMLFVLNSAYGVSSDSFVVINCDCGHTAWVVPAIGRLGGVPLCWKGSELVK